MQEHSFEAFILEQLDGLGEVRSKAMFGGHGLYSGKHFFGILHHGRVFFKTDPESRPDYISAGSEPFQPKPGQTLGSYYEVPASVIEDASTLQFWAARAAAIAS